jgi:hypothetical protein
MVWAYLFEAKGIQRYIFDSGPLRDLVGASDLVAGLAYAGRDPESADKSDRSTEEPDLIGQVLAKLGITEGDASGQVRFSRRTSGAFCVHADDEGTLQRIQALWRLAVSLRCPGLEYADAGPVQGDNNIKAIKAAYKSGSAVRYNTAAELPPTGHPFTAFNRRTGRVATKLYVYRNDEGEDVIPVDGVTEPQRAHASFLQRQQKKGKLDRVARKFLPRVHKNNRPYIFPRNLDPREGSDLDPEEGNDTDNPLFPFLDDDRRIAVIHADLSGLGEVYRDVTDPESGYGICAVSAVATAIEESIECSVQGAVDAVLLSETVHKEANVNAFGADGPIVLPARPVM